MARVIRECRNPKCGKDFASKTSRALYCSPECNKQYHHQKASTTLTFQIGSITIQINDVRADIDKEELKQLILSKIPADLLQTAMNHVPTTQSQQSVSQ